MSMEKDKIRKVMTVRKKLIESIINIGLETPLEIIMLLKKIIIEKEKTKSDITCISSPVTSHPSPNTNWTRGTENRAIPKERGMIINASAKSVTQNLSINSSFFFVTNF